MNVPQFVVLILGATLLITLSGLIYGAEQAPAYDSEYNPNYNPQYVYIIHLFYYAGEFQVKDIHVDTGSPSIPVREPEDGLTFVMNAGSYQLYSFKFNVPGEPSSLTFVVPYHPAATSIYILSPDAVLMKSISLEPYRNKLQVTDDAQLVRSTPPLVKVSSILFLALLVLIILIIFYYSNKKSKSHKAKSKVKRTTRRKR